MGSVGRKPRGSLKRLQGPWLSLCLLPGQHGKLHQVSHTTLAQPQSCRTKCLWIEIPEITSQKTTFSSCALSFLGHFVTVSESLLTQPECHVKEQPPPSSATALWVGHFTSSPFSSSPNLCLPCFLLFPFLIIWHPLFSSYIASSVSNMKSNACPGPRQASFMLIL